MVQVVQVVGVVRIISPGDMHLGNIWFLWSKQSNYQEKLRCHACDERMGGKWKIGQCSVRPETAKSKKHEMPLPPQKKCTAKMASH